MVLANINRIADKITVVLFICIAMAVVLQCQAHATPLDDEYRTASSTHDPPASAHLMLDLACMSAVLPDVLAITYLLCIFFNAESPWSKYISPTFPIFTPPKNMAAQ